MILFLAAMNIVLEFVGVAGAPRYKLSNGNELPLQRGFMDDLTLMSLTVNGARALLCCAGLEVGKDAGEATKIEKLRCEIWQVYGCAAV